MAIWIYEARTVDGRVVRGTRDAPDRRSALEALRSEGFFVSRIEARAAKTQSQPQPLRARANPLDASIVAATAPVAAVAGAVSEPLIGELTQAKARPARPKFIVADDAPTLAQADAQTLIQSGASTPNTARPPAKFDPVVTQPGPPRIGIGVGPGVLRPMGQAATAPLASQPFLHASQQDLSNFFRQLAALMHAGTGIGAALQTLAENAANKSLRVACEQMSKRAMTGEPFSEGMKAFPGLFSPLMIGITSAGERGGFMEQSFTRLADYAERDYQLEQSIKRETWYPKLIVFCSIIIPGVVPLVLSGPRAFFAQVGPPLIIIVLAIIAWKVWNFVKPAFTSAISAFRFGNISPAKIFDEIKLMVPVVGKTARALASAKFCRALGALYSAGVGPSEAVRLGAEACGNRAIAERALGTIPQLNAGVPLTQCMKETKIFNPLALQMMRVGEESGDLDTQLDKAADFLETNAETTIKQAVPVLGIVAFLCVALYVGSLAMGVVSSYGQGMDDIMKQ